MKFPLNKFRNLSNGFVKENAPHFFLIFERENIAIGASGECFLKDRVTSETRCSVKGNQVYMETVTNRFRMHMTLSSDVFTLCEIMQKFGCPVNNITKRNEGMNPVSGTANAPLNRNLTQGSDSFFSDSSFSQHSQNTEYSHSARSSQSSQSERLSSEYSFSQSSTRSSAADDFDSIFAEERNCDARNPRNENGRGRVEPMDTQEMFSQSLYNAPTQPAGGLQSERYLTMPGERKPSFGSQDPFSQSQNSGHLPFNNVPSQRLVGNSRLPAPNSQPTRTTMPNDRELLLCYAVFLEAQMILRLDDERPLSRFMARPFRRVCEHLVLCGGLGKHYLINMFRSVYVMRSEIQHIAGCLVIIGLCGGYVINKMRLSGFLGLRGPLSTSVEQRLTAIHHEDTTNKRNHTCNRIHN